MKLKLVYLVMVTSGVLGDDFLSHLYGLNGDNQMVICLKAAEGRHERACSGALLAPDWVGVRAGCLHQHPKETMLALRLTKRERCSDISHGYSTLSSRSVMEVKYHPWSDLALVLVDRPYLALDSHPNSTAWTVPRTFRKHGLWVWMKRYMKHYALARDQFYHHKHLTRTMASNRSPLLMFFLAIFMPSLIFVLVFIYVIFYSDSEVSPFKKFQYTKKDSKV